MTRRMNRIVAPWTLAVILTLVAGSLAGFATASETSLHMTSEPGDYIGGGQTYDYLPTDGAFTLDGSQGEVISVSFHTPNYEHWWYLNFAAPSGHPLAPGTYTGATRYPFQSAEDPGLSVYGDGRGCNQLTGTFTVKQVTYGSSGEVLSLWATFEQHCEGAGPALRGDVRYNADVVVIVTAPPAFTVDRGHELAFDVSATDVQNRPLTLTATLLPAGATFNDYGDGTGSFRWTPTADQIGFHTATFRASNGEGGMDEAMTTIHVTGDLMLRVESDPGDYIGGGSSFVLTPPNATFTASGWPGGVNVTVTTAPYISWYLFFAPPEGTVLAPGRYPGALRLADPSHPGLDINSPGQGCNSIEGEFVVKQIQLTPDGLASFWAVFEQHCEGATPALRGEIRYNANVVVSVSAPFRRSVERLHALTFDVTASEVDGGPLNWQVLDLPSGASFAQAGGNSGTFSWAPSFEQGGSYAVTFVATNDLGVADTAVTVITVAGETSLTVSGEPDAYPAPGQALHYTTEDGSFRAEPSYTGGVNVLFGSFPFTTWRLEFAPPAGQPLQVGRYPDAVMPGYQQPGQAGLYVSGPGGCSQIHASFHIKELTRTPSGAIESFWARFTQYCDRSPGALEGEIRFNVNAPLLVNAPPGANGATGDTLQFTVTGTAAGTVDLNAVDLPLGAMLLTNADGSRTFRWIPTDGDVGRKLVSFAGAAEAHRDTAVTAIRVLKVNHRPLANAGGPYRGSPGVPVTFDGSGSTDPDGDPLVYSWSFGDGLYAEGSQPSHTYASAGDYVASLSVSDGYLGAIATATVAIVETVAARAFTTGGDDVIRLQSQSPSCVRIEPLNGSFMLTDVDLASIILRSRGTGTVESISAISQRTSASADRDRNGVDEIEVCFAKDDLRQLFAYRNGRSAVTLQVEGLLTSGGRFGGSFEVYVKSGVRSPIVSVARDRATGLPQLRIDMDSPRPVRVRIYDVSGRLLRIVERDAGADPSIDLGGALEGRAPLRAGVYFYKVEGLEGSPAGKFVLLR
jgi:hypothetical protein